VSPPLLAVDGDSLAHRAYHALPQSIRDAEGKPANMIVGFTNMLVTLWEAEQPRGVFVGFDSIGEPTYRHELLAGYQSGRDFPPVLTDQLDRLPPLVEALGFAAGKAAGFEADDFLAAAVRDEEARGGSTLVLTSDRDMCQLTSPLTTLLMPRRGVSDIARVGPDEVRERFGVEPEQIPDFIALRGDQSDKIPGAPGVGPARAAAILKKHGTLEASLEAGGFPSLAQELRDYRRIATLDASAPLPPLDDNVPTWVEASTLVRSWGLNQLADRLAARAEA
jgi:DNA polymerase-1